MPMLHQQTLPEGYATIRRSKGRNDHKHKLRTSSTSSIEMTELSPRRKSIKRTFDSEIMYAKKLNEVFDESIELDEDVLNGFESDADGMSQFSDSINKRTTFETFKPRNSIESGDDGSDKDLQQSNECFQSLPYDIIMSPLKSPQYINQLNAMRSKSTVDGVTRQFPLYSRPESPKYGKILYHHRSTSPSADSMDNSSSNSSTYSSNHHAAFQHASMTQSLHLPSTTNRQQGEDENVILINVQPHARKHPPLKATNLNYRKSFSHFNGNGNGRLVSNNIDDSSEQINRCSMQSSLTMTKSLYSPSLLSHVQHRRFATLAHPKEKQHFENDNKLASSLGDLIHWDPILSCKIGSQTTLRTKPPVPWYELAIKKEFRQSCPPLQHAMFGALVTPKRHNKTVRNYITDLERRKM
ncbi:CLUMA_CG001375, isoform A [Clunio marinus]|uniref:CLUMA_CG001375, isoform A n=1 Tax=Clunio marinus TaxID=568069 RepID=A0A1J1HJ36_9DIPT|nr:CLUMA_CG001375, isoform A [Clunio marinus]